MTGDGERAAVAAAGLLDWYEARERDVPWRDEDRPYRVWVAEVMAQQTRVETVREYWSSFLERFPDVRALAAADRDDVLKAWEGLGYYARARRLHDAARRVVREHGGRLPEDPERLEELPGIGPYTAGAVASLAFGRPAPAVDGNTRRVLARLFDLARPSDGRLRSAAMRLLEHARDRPADLNQAIMDLGGAVCTPGSPDCGRCPVADACLALERGTVSERPPPRSRPDRPHHDVGVGVVWDGEGRVLIARRPEDAMLGGMWEFPGGKLEDDESPPEAVRRELREEMRIAVEVGGLVARVDHGYSHLRVTLHAHHARHLSGAPRARAATDWAWVEPDRMEDYAFPKASHAVIDRLVEGERPDGFSARSARDGSGQVG